MPAMRTECHGLPDFPKETANCCDSVAIIPQPALLLFNKVML